MLSLQKSYEGFDGQLSYFTRYSNLHFMPDPIGDLLFNGIASDVSRQSYTNGIQGDASYVVNAAHTLRAGFTVSAEKAWVDNTSLVEACMICDGTDNGDSISITDDVAKLGWLAGVYVQDEWKVTNQLTMNAGLRFDQMWQFVNANQLSPRISFTYKPFENTTFHAGYARYFTPPVLVEAAPANIALFNNTTGAPNAGQPADPVLPERSHYFDAGVVQKIKFGCASDGKNCSNLDLGVDAYYKIATDLIDNGQFGQALVLSAVQLCPRVQRRHRIQSLKYTNGNFQGYGNLAVAQQRATNVVSNQYLFDNTTPLATLGGLTELPVHPDALDLYRPQPVRHRVGRRDLPVLRPPGHRGGSVWRQRTIVVRNAAERRHDLTAAACATATPISTRHRLHAGQCRRRARIPAAERSRPMTIRFGRRQPVRQHLRDQGRLRHRRVRAAIRAAPRLLPWSLEEDMRSRRLSITANRPSTLSTAIKGSELAM